MNIVLLEPKNRGNLATLIRSGQNFGVNCIFVIGGFVRDAYKGNIHKFSHQMDTQNGLSSLTLMYFETLEDFLGHLPAQTTLVVVETFTGAADLRTYCHPDNATYMFGRESIGIGPAEKRMIEAHFGKLNEGIPDRFLDGHKKTARLDFVKIETSQSLNLGVCGSIVMYDRYLKTAESHDKALLEIGVKDSTLPPGH
jgi:tRNA(Leu) C34 or U34 (ribose-2'-O)-methylase TrmL